MDGIDVDGTLAYFDENGGHCDLRDHLQRGPAATVKLIHVIHERCDEPVASTYLLAPDTDDGAIEAALKRAQDAYLAEIEKAKKIEPPTNGQRFSQPPYAEFPDKTVREVLEIHKIRKAAWEEWSADYERTTRSFASFAVEEGFKLLFEGFDEDDEFVLDWGHRHGTRIDLDEHHELDETGSPQDAVETGTPPTDPTRAQ